MPRRSLGRAELLQINKRTVVGDPMHANDLKFVVERQFFCGASLIQTVPVRARLGGHPIWEGVVYMFRLLDHPMAERAYAWSVPTDEGPRSHIFTALDVGPINSPAAAVCASVVEDQRASAFAARSLWSTFRKVLQCGT